MEQKISDHCTKVFFFSAFQLLNFFYAKFTQTQNFTQSNFLLTNIIILNRLEL